MPVDLGTDERRVLCAGLDQLDGPARPTEEDAVALGFTNLPQLKTESRRMSALLSDGEALSSTEMVRALLVTEIVFASDFFGAGVEWPTVTGLDDDETIAVLRRLQRKLVGEYASARQ